MQVHLSFIHAKRGASFEDRLILGYHANSLKMALVYSRDSVARPLALLTHVLTEIKQEPLILIAPGAGGLNQCTPLDQVESFSFNPSSQEFAECNDC